MKFDAHDKIFMWNFYDSHFHEQQTLETNNVIHE